MLLFLVLCFRVYRLNSLVVENWYKGLSFLSQTNRNTLFDLDSSP